MASSFGWCHFFCYDVSILNPRQRLVVLVLNFIEINFEVIDAEEMFLVGGFTNTKLLA